MYLGPLKCGQVIGPRFSGLRLWVEIVTHSEVPAPALVRTYNMTIKDFSKYVLLHICITSSADLDAVVLVQKKEPKTIGFIKDLGYRIYLVPVNYCTYNTNSPKDAERNSVTLMHVNITTRGNLHIINEQNRVSAAVIT